MHGPGLVGVLHGGDMGADRRHVGARANLWRCAARGGPAQVWREDMSSNYQHHRKWHNMWPFVGRSHHN